MHVSGVLTVFPIAYFPYFLSHFPLFAWDFQQRSIPLHSVCNVEEREDKLLDLDQHHPQNLID